MIEPRDKRKQCLLSRMSPSYLSRGWELANGVLSFAVVCHLKFCSVEITGVVGLATYLPHQQHVADLWAGQFETMLEKTIPVILGWSS